MTLRVQKRMCATCIYRPSTPLDLNALLDQVRDPRLDGHFKSYRVCHHSASACCVGFWATHKDDFDLGQLAQRLGLVEYVEEDNIDGI